MRIGLAAAALALALASACAGAGARRATWVVEEEPPPSRGALALAAQDLGCDPGRVRMKDWGVVVQASGCNAVVYFEKKSKAEWSRVGAAHALSAADDLQQAAVRAPPGTRLTKPVMVEGRAPAIKGKESEQLHSWTPKAHALCVLGVDGALHACLVSAEDGPVGDAVAKALPEYRYRPATASDGAPIPVPYDVEVDVFVTKPNCRNLSSPMLRATCERAVATSRGPADFLEKHPPMVAPPLASPSSQ